MLVELSAAVESRDPSTRGHAARVTALADAVARRLGWHEERIATLRIGGTLHDVGKVAVPITVLLKRGPLTDAELEQIRVHPAAGARVVASIEAARPRSRSSSTTTSAGTAAATRRACAARRSSRRRGCWRSPTPTTR